MRHDSIISTVGMDSYSPEENTLRMQQNDLLLASEEDHVLEKNKHYVTSLLSQILDALIDKVEAMPRPIRAAMKFMYEILSHKYPDKSAEQKYEVICENIIYRWILLVCFFNPDSYGLMKYETLEKNARSTLLSISKVFYSMMRGRLENDKDEQRIFKDFIAEKRPVVLKFY